MSSIKTTIARQLTFLLNTMRTNKETQLSWKKVYHTKDDEGLEYDINSISIFKKYFVDHGLISEEGSIVTLTVMGKNVDCISTNELSEEDIILFYGKLKPIKPNFAVK